MEHPVHLWIKLSAP